jgi:phosphatidylinositol-binding clathrin assembly protein
VRLIAITASTYADMMRPEHYFEMSRYDAERALEIYKIFSKQTTLVVDYLAVARQFETSTRLEVPKLKHAPTSLTASLEEYLHDPDFEINRRQYLAQQEAKKGRGATNGANKARTTASPRPAQKEALLTPKPPQPSAGEPQPKGPGPDLIDFFESIEQNQQPMTQPQASNQQMPQVQQQHPQPYQQEGLLAPVGGFPPQQLNQPQQFSAPFAQQSNPPANQLAQPVQQNFDAVGYGSYSLQTQPGYNAQLPLPNVPQINLTPFQSPVPQHQPQQALGLLGSGQQQTNPFRQSMMPMTSAAVPYASSPPVSSPPTRPQGTNPFAKGSQVQPTISSQASSPFATPTSTISPAPAPPQIQTTQPIRPTPAGTNPFARNTSPPQHQQPTSLPPSTLGPNSTSSTNPFRQSVFQGQQSGASWQQNQGTMGGLEQMPTIPVFPRQGESNAQQQQKWL